MSLQNEVIESSWDAIQKIGSSERTLFVGIMISVLVFVGFLVWNSSTSQSEQRESFLSAMDKRDEKISTAIEKMSDALDKNTEVMNDLRAKIK